MAALQLPLELGLQSGLSGGQERPAGVIDQIELEPRTRPSVSHLVEALQGLDGIRENALAALPVGAGFGVVGEGRDHMHPVFGKKGRQIGVLFVGHQNREVAAVHDFFPQPPAF